MGSTTITGTAISGSGSGTCTLLTMKSDFFKHQGQHWGGTATGGSVNKLTDSALIDLGSEDFPFPVENRQLRVTSGAASGDLKRVARVDKSVGDLYAANPPFSSTGPASTHTYEVWGNSIHGSTPLTNLFNDVLRRLRWLRREKLTLLDRRGTYDISSLVKTWQEVNEVYTRLADTTQTSGTTGNKPYTERMVPSWQARDAIGVATATLTIAGTPTGGHYHVFLGGDDSGEIAYDASAATVQTALRTLFGMSTATVAAVGSTPDFTHTVTFPSTSMETPLTVDDSALTGGSSPTVTPAVATTRHAVLLDIYPAETVVAEPSIQQTEIWVEYWEEFTAFTADTSTVEDKYREWLVWEAILEHAKIKMDQGTDKGRWRDLAARANGEARACRRALFDQPHYRPNHAWHWQGH